MENIKNMELTAVFEPADEGGFVGYILEIEGVNTQGDTLAETKENLKEALELLLSVRRELFTAKSNQIVEKMRLVA